MSDIQRIDVVWAENRDEIFMQKLEADIERLSAAGFDDKTILRFIGDLPYVYFWTRNNKHLWPVDKLPKGHEWSEGIVYKYSVSRGKKSKRETWTFLPIDDDLYIRCGASKSWVTGTNFNDKSFGVYRNWRTIKANEALEHLQSNAHFEVVLRHFWEDSGLRQGYNADLPWRRGDSTRQYVVRKVNGKLQVDPAGTNYITSTSEKKGDE